MAFNEWPWPYERLQRIRISNVFRNAMWRGYFRRLVQSVCSRFSTVAYHRRHSRERALRLSKIWTFPSQNPEDKPVQIPRSMPKLCALSSQAVSSKYGPSQLLHFLHNWSNDGNHSPNVQLKLWMWTELKCDLSKSLQLTQANYKNKRRRCLPIAPRRLVEARAAENQRLYDLHRALAAPTGLAHRSLFPRCQRHPPTR